MTAPDATPARGDVEIEGRVYTKRGQRWTFEPRNNHGRKEVDRRGRLHKSLEVIATLTAERDALAQRVRALEAGPDDATCDRVIKMVSGGGMWALINNETKREYLRAALTPEATP